MDLFSSNLSSEEGERQLKAWPGLAYLLAGQDMRGYVGFAPHSIPLSSLHPPASCPYQHHAKHQYYAIENMLPRTSNRALKEPKSDQCKSPLFPSMSAHARGESPCLRDASSSRHDRHRITGRPGITGSISQLPAAFRNQPQIVTTLQARPKV